GPSRRRIQGWEASQGRRPTADKAARADRSVLARSAINSMGPSETDRERASVMNRTTCFGLAVLVALNAFACGGGDDAGSTPGTGTGGGAPIGDGGTMMDGNSPDVMSQPPAPVSDKSPCIISADCPAGTHCDLGECLQDCNTDQPCSGAQSCSAR